jgi:hypothetical protein
LLQHFRNAMPLSGHESVEIRRKQGPKHIYGAIIPAGMRTSIRLRQCIEPRSKRIIRPL